MIYLGMQGIMFSDVIRTEKQMQKAIFPRLLGMAERVWHKAPWELLTDTKERNEWQMMDLNRFALVVNHNEMSRLEKRNIHIMVPPPGAR